jgi:hypothetical protein
MSDVPVWCLFAFMDGDEEGRNDERRVVADWQVQDVVRWCTTRGYDHIYLSRDPMGRRCFEKQPTPDGVKHHSNIVPLQPRSSSGDHEPESEPTDPEGSVA